MNLFHGSQVLGKNIREVLLPETYETILKNLNDVIDTREPVLYTFNFKEKDGIQILSQLSLPIVENGEITSLLSVTRNITNEENLKLKLVEKICELNSIIEEKKQLEKQKELFLTTLTYDLKNPVQAQIMSLKLLKKGNFGELNSEQCEMINTILESSSYMQNMLYSILNTYKYDNGIIHLNKDYIDINLLIQNCINEVNALAKSKQIRIVFKSFVKNEKLYADYEQLRRVVGNLLNNALNYSYHNTDMLICVSLNEGNMVFKFSNKGNPIQDKEKYLINIIRGKICRETDLDFIFQKKL